MDVHEEQSIYVLFSFY